MRIEIEHNIPQVQVTLRGFIRNVAYGISQALNQTVLAAQGQVRRELPRAFKIRSSWVSRGVRVRLSSKTNLEAAVGSVDPFMKLQELGGEKEQGGKEMAVPIGPGGASKALRGSDLMGKTLRSKWPSAMPGTFVIKTRAGVPMILQRTERYRSLRKGRGGGFSIVRDDKVRVLYTLHRKVRIKAKWNLFGLVSRTAGFVLPPLLRLEILSALAKAR